jgi:hypothetical protein
MQLRADHRGCRVVQLLFVEIVLYRTLNYEHRNFKNLHRAFIWVLLNELTYLFDHLANNVQFSS